MKRFYRLAAWVMLPFMALALAMTGAALARVEVNVDLSTQRMHVSVDGKPYATWRISSGRREGNSKEYYTPRGSYHPKWLERMHYSRKYDNAPMPYAIFITGGVAIHGTSAVSRLGRPASHGCIRISTPAAAELFRLVQQHGRRNTIVRITGSTDVAYRKLASTRRVARRSSIRKRRKARRLASHRGRAASRRVARRVVRHRRSHARRLAYRRPARRYRAPRRRYVPRFDFLQIYGAVLPR